MFVNNIRNTDLIVKRMTDNTLTGARRATGISVSVVTDRSVVTERSVTPERSVTNVRYVTPSRSVVTERSVINEKNSWHSLCIDEHAPKKSRKLPNKSGTKNKNRRAVSRRLSFTGTDEVLTLHSELTSVHQTYIKTIMDKDEEIASLKHGMYITSTLFAKDIDTLTKDMESVQQDLDITEGELSIYQKSEKEWIGRTVRLKFILDQVIKLGALRKGHDEWVEPMLNDMDIPEVSVNIKDEFVPTAQTDNIDWTDDQPFDEDQPLDSTDDVGMYGPYETFDEEQANQYMSEGVIEFSDRVLEVTLIIQRAWKENRRRLKDKLDLELSVQYDTIVEYDTMSDNDMEITDDEDDEYAEDDEDDEGQYSWSQTEWPPLEPYCATKIQSIWRGYITRKNKVTPSLVKIRRFWNLDCKVH
jgi:hypothetical protein